MNRRLNIFLLVGLGQPLPRHRRNTFNGVFRAPLHKSPLVVNTAALIVVFVHPVQIYQSINMFLIDKYILPCRGRLSYVKSDGAHIRLFLTYIILTKLKNCAVCRHGKLTGVQFRTAVRHKVGNIRTKERRKHFGLGIFELICATPNEGVAELRRARVHKV